MEKRANPHLNGSKPQAGSEPTGRSTDKRVVALVLAAGLSTRMGQSKPLLPFGSHTVIEQILTVLAACELAGTLVVVGHERYAVAARLNGASATLVYNPFYATGEMLSSLQAGLQAAQATNADAVLVALGDQPGMEPEVVSHVLSAYHQGHGGVIIPSYQMRRGHPILIDQRFWGDILALKDGQTLRDFMRAVQASIYHVNVDTASILRDMDTPDDYQRELSAFNRRRMD